MHKRTTPTHQSTACTLTPKEQEILQLVALGQTDAEIAQHLCRSTKTIGHHVQHIISKLNARNRTDAVVAGILAGLINRGLDDESVTTEADTANPSAVSAGGMKGSEHGVPNKEVKASADGTWAIVPALPT